MRIKSVELRKAVNRFAANMRSRLAEKEAKGYTGWNGPYPTKNLVKEMRRDLELADVYGPIKEQSVDLGCRAMMLWFRSPE